MRIGNLQGRLALFHERGAIDVEHASESRFSSDPQAVYEVWDDFVAWATEVLAAPEGFEVKPYRMEDLGVPTPAPAQIFAIGLNYAAHAKESNFAVPDTFPPTFTKFRTSLSGPISTVVIPPGGNVDWEIELVAVIGRRAERVGAAEAWSYVAGLSAGQDISERITQLSGPAPQFSLGKSFPGFAPIGPWVVTIDEFVDPDDVELYCEIDGETVQHGRTRDFVFNVPALIEGLSRVAPLLPGDVIFCGTPSGVGQGRTPKRFLRAGEVLTSRVEGIGGLRQTFIDG